MSLSYLKDDKLISIGAVISDVSEEEYIASCNEIEEYEKDLAFRGNGKSIYGKMFL